MPGLCSWRLQDIQPLPIQCMTIPLADTWNCRVYIYSIYIKYISLQYTYTSIQYISLFLMQYKCTGLTSIVYGTVHTNCTVVVLLHIHFSSLRSSFYNSISIITNFTYATMCESNLMAYVNNLFTLFNLTYYI